MQFQAGLVLRAVLLLGVTLLVVIPASAHPGSGIAVAKDGQVYFLDTGSGLWKIDAQGGLTKVDGTRFHWLTLDEGNALARTRLPAHARGDIVKVGASPLVLLASDWPIAADQNGHLYYPSGSPGSLRLMRAPPTGDAAIFATLPATATGGPLTHVNGIAVAPDGSVYCTEDTVVRRITSTGLNSIVARVPRQAGRPLTPGIAADSGPLLRGLQVDAKGTIYVAAEGDGRVLKIAPDGTVTTIMQSGSPWSPTAVAVLGADVYVLEFLHTDRDVRADWFPRVRRLAADGKETILVTVDRMPGARTSVPPAPLAAEELRATLEESGGCRLDWKAPVLGAGVQASLGAVSHYRIERRQRSVPGRQREDWRQHGVTPTETRATINGLERGVEHEFRIVAINAGGASVPSNVATVVR